MTPLTQERLVAPHLAHLRTLPFVRDVHLAWEPRPRPRGFDALLALRTPRRTYTLALEIKRTFLDRTLTNAIIAERITLDRRHRLAFILAARYVPRPTGERLADAGVNFVDRTGNIHLRLGDNYHVRVLGRREPPREPTARRPGFALIQLLFVLLADPAAAGWSIRRLAEAAGIGKTAAALGLQRLVRLGILRRTRDGAGRVADPTRLAEDFLTGYGQILRPHLLIGRFRAPERDPDRLLGQIATAAKRAGVPWAVTGGPAAFRLERFYRGDQVPVFLTHIGPELQRELRLVPDRDGPVVLLRAFGQLLGWRAVDDVMIAHPWLVYAELLQHREPRALEAAAEIREEYLKA